jgi:hypothetical protein
MKSWEFWLGLVYVQEPAGLIVEIGGQGSARQKNYPVLGVENMFPTSIFCFVARFTRTKKAF